MDSAYVNMPAPILDIIGWEDTASISGGISLAMPMPSLSALANVVSSTDGAVQLYMPRPVLSIVAYQQNVATVALGDWRPVVYSSGQAGYISDVSISAPAPVIAITGYMDSAVLQLPGLSLNIVGTPGVTGAIVVDFPLVSISATSSVGVLGGVDLVSPNFILKTYSSNNASLALPALNLALSGKTGAVARVGLVLGLPVLSVSGNSEFTGMTAMTAPPIRINSTGYRGSVGSVGLYSKSASLQIAGASGNAGAAYIAAPPIRITITGHSDTIGIAALILLPILSVSGGTQRNNGLKTIVMHTENSAITTYDNYAFNSLAKFNGVYIGAKSDGIFALHGDSDDGASISASAKIGITDFGTSHLKKMDRCYVGYSSDGDMILRVSTDGVTTRDYVLRGTGAPGVHGGHVRIGKGIAARYWQFEIFNNAGSNFGLDVLEFKPTELRRRIGKNNA